MRLSLTALIALAAFGCEDGPRQLFRPNQGDPATQNGFKSGPVFTQTGTKDFETQTGEGDRIERARFCDERENEAVVRELVGKPVVPDVGLGGIPLWSPTGGPVHANDLIGRPEDGKFCDPEVYSNALVWGPTNEIIAFINEETKLVESVVATQQYLGTMPGTYTDAVGKEQAALIKLRDQIVLGGRKLTEYTSSAQQAQKPNAWLNHQNLTDLYRMVRQTFFGAEPIPANFNCVAAQVCDVIYTGADEAQPQTTVVVFQDSGLVLAFSPEGHVIQLSVEPVRVAPFETSAEIALTQGGKVAPKLDSISRPGCTVALSGQTNWSQFADGCVDDARTLARATYQVANQRDSVDVVFNGVTLSYLRPIAKGEVMKDGEHPAGAETLYGVQFTRTLNAPVREFVPEDLAARYAAILTTRLRALVAADPGHPLKSFTVPVPAGLSRSPQRIGELFFEANGQRVSYVPYVVAQVQAAYQTFTPEQQALAQPVLNPLYLIEPFVEGVLDAFTAGAYSQPGTFRALSTTNDRRWVIGRAHFIQDGQPVRVVVQYSLNYGAVTAVGFERGESQLDTLYASLNAQLRPAAAPSPYYGIELSQLTTNPLGLNGEGFAVIGKDLALGTLDVQLPGGELTVPGAHLDDRAGYSRQLRGERWEFVPAHQISLSGKETWMAFWVEEDGQIGRIAQSTFKAPQRLCAGPTPARSLSIAYGDDVRAKVSAWAQANPDAYRTCEVVFNYSANGNVLESVVSLSGKVSFSTVDGRATQVAIWR